MTVYFFWFERYFASFLFSGLEYKEYFSWESLQMFLCLWPIFVWGMGRYSAIHKKYPLHLKEHEKPLSLNIFSSNSVASGRYIIWRSLAWNWFLLFSFFAYYIIYTPRQFFIEVWLNSQFYFLVAFPCRFCFKEIEVAHQVRVLIHCCELSFLRRQFQIEYSSIYFTKYQCKCLMCPVIGWNMNKTEFLQEKDFKSLKWLKYTFELKWLVGSLPLCIRKVYCLLKVYVNSIT